MCWQQLSGISNVIYSPGYYYYCTTTDNRWIKYNYIILVFETTLKYFYLLTRFASRHLLSFIPIIFRFGSVELAHRSLPLIAPFDLLSISSLNFSYSFQFTVYGKATTMRIAIIFNALYYFI